MDEVARLRAENARLARLARTDPLTGVLNRRGLSHCLELTGERWCAIFVDIDDFASINARFGYTMGDAVLRAAVVRLDHALGDGAFLGRVGGDEFVGLLPETPLSMARDLADAARAAVGQVPLPGEGALTCSIGIATFQAPARTLEEVIGATQAPLLAAKGAGKNRVNVAR